MAPSGVRRRRPCNTATTRFPGNQNAFQEDLPDGGTHIRLGDVSCKSLVADLAGGLSKLAPPLARMDSGHRTIRGALVNRVLRAEALRRRLDGVRRPFVRRNPPTLPGGH